MDSPFPGMDPYLEDPAVWADFHATFINYWREAIAEVLPETYEARLDETIHIVPLSEATQKLLYPDIALTGAKRKAAKGNGAALALLEPVVIPHDEYEEFRQARIHVLHRPERKLVAVLEMLSPFNKTGDGFSDYRNKRLALLQQKVHLVELDLLLAGRRLPLAKPLPHGDYYAFVSRGDRRPQCEVYHWLLRQPLPPVPVPLLAPDPDIVVDLQAVFSLAFRRGRYARSLPYGRAPKTLRRRADRAWVMKQKPEKK